MKYHYEHGGQMDVYGLSTATMVKKPEKLWLAVLLEALGTMFSIAHTRNVT